VEGETLNPTVMPGVTPEVDWMTWALAVDHDTDEGSPLEY